jgi:hypothetical protein
VSWSRRDLLATVAAAVVMGLALPARAASPRTIKWDDLVPPGWDPSADMQGLAEPGLSDADPRASEMMERLRKAWDNAPVNAQMAGQSVRLPGYVVPLEETKDGLTEFLLVPYFGACIHTPPPPANQIVHVVSKTPLAGIRSMAAVWAAGTLATTRYATLMGTSGYRMEAASVELYKR